jgi:hypothetical protein
MSIIVEYNPNNSGGSWWLKDKDWKALEAAGWRVAWAHQEFRYTDEGDHERDAEGFPVLVPQGQGNSEYASLTLDKPDKEGVVRYLGALARYAYRKTDDPIAAMREFERITGQDITDEGCNCCGCPHHFSWKDENGEGHYAGGTGAIPYLFGENAPKTLRQAIEAAKK